MPNELYTVDADFKNPRKLSDLNPWLGKKKMTKSELISYLDIDGKECYGVLYYPVDYDENQKYPLVCEIYERFYDNGYRSSMNIIANAGYFGFRPSVNFEEGYPGEAWIKGVTAGINKLIEKGLVDEDKLGVHGTSYGGYATSLLIAQTDRFAAGINISGKTNIISFLGDSPKIGTRNYAAAEVGQDRIGDNLWDAPMKYLNTSAILLAPVASMTKRSKPTATPAQLGSPLFIASICWSATSVACRSGRSASTNSWRIRPST